MAQANLNIRIDEDVKKQGEELFAGLGMNMTTAINVFLRQAIRKGGIPFESVRAMMGFITNSTKSACVKRLPI